MIIMYFSKVKRFILFFLFINCCFTYLSYAQKVNHKEINKAYDDLVQQNNTGLFDGPEFQDIYLTNSNSNRYFDQFDFSKGSVVYNDQKYFDVFMKYDIFDDQIIVRSDDDLNLFKVNLNSENITEFTIQDRRFVSIPALNDINNTKFYEIAYKGENSILYIKHRKEIKETTINYTLRYDFQEKNYYVLFINKSYQSFESVKELKKILSQREKQIQSFYKIHKDIYKSNIDQFMIDLIKNLNL